LTIVLTFPHALFVEVRWNDVTLLAIREWSRRYRNGKQRAHPNVPLLTLPGPYSGNIPSPAEYSANLYTCIAKSAYFPPFERTRMTHRLLLPLTNNVRPSHVLSFGSYWNPPISDIASPKMEIGMRKWTCGVEEVGSEIFVKRNARIDGSCVVL
jgi:hypothetical protein